jgi:hypothetical protein
VREVQHCGGCHDGQLHDLPQLRRLQVRLKGAKKSPAGAGLNLLVRKEMLL